MRFGQTVKRKRHPGHGYERIDCPNEDIEETTYQCFKHSLRVATRFKRTLAARTTSVSSSLRDGQSIEVPRRHEGRTRCNTDQTARIMYNTRCRCCPWLSRGAPECIYLLRAILCIAGQCFNLRAAREGRDTPDQAGRNAALDAKSAVVSRRRSDIPRKLYDSHHKDLGASPLCDADAEPSQRR